ncbi:phosphoadenylyl-sulfate reductase [Thermoactinomyces mirandus]|uniref:Adenosine 5'-phosphosulfate reductase n=1 Tax=Thermoactinomyces mirandus TaxID=2756294 RepID=A0A7W2AQ09_9BACL|nr:phosphoadenylyl-sulfate reductase [Thermoactinomyces mirandus]MBA4601504.1 phosphoadenylyl-sulfate reductase [Thermoactinomyces mirandus]
MIQPRKWPILTEEEKKDEQKIKVVAARMRDKHPQDIIRWGIEQLGVSSLALACSFGCEDIALLDMALKVNPDLDIFYLDTDLHFKETYEVRDRLSGKYQKQFIRVSPDLTLEEQAVKYGEKLWKKDPNLCCNLRKVEPLKKYLRNYQGWITGIRREQAPTRAHAEVVEWDQGFQLIKLNPLAFWNSKQVWNYIFKNQLPYNPLHDHRYPSIGCEPCTRPVLPGEDPRAGRWSGTDKIECGLHNSPVS